MRTYMCHEEGNFISCIFLYTVLPQNLCAVRFCFKAMFDVATVRGQRLQRSARKHVHKSPFVFTHDVCATHVDISIVAGFRDVPRFRVNVVFRM